MGCVGHCGVARENGTVLMQDPSRGPQSRCCGLALLKAGSAGAVRSSFGWAGLRHRPGSRSRVNPRPGARAPDVRGHGPGEAKYPSRGPGLRGHGLALLKAGGVVNTRRSGTRRAGDRLHGETVLAAWGWTDPNRCSMRSRFRCSTRSRKAKVQAGGQGPGPAEVRRAWAGPRRWAGGAWDGRGGRSLRGLASARSHLDFKGPLVHQRKSGRQPGQLRRGQQRRSTQNPARSGHGRRR